jgi:hypothetical protein
MRQAAVFVALLAGSGLFFGAHGQATAGPAVLAAPVVSHSVVEEAGWRRYCRRYGCSPEVVLPGADIVPEAEVDIDVDVPEAEGDIDVDVPAVVVLPPPRPLTCGQYRYWNGNACVDARYTDPYLGPR